MLEASTSPVTFLTEKASLKTDLPSFLFTATAVLSWPLGPCGADEGCRVGQERDQQQSGEGSHIRFLLPSAGVGEISGFHGRTSGPGWRLDAATPDEAQVDWVMSTFCSALA